MVNTKHIFFITLFAFQACSHIGLQSKEKPIDLEFTEAKQQQIYKNLEQEMRTNHTTHLKECNCMKAFYRELFENPNNTSRYVFDRKVGEQALELSKEKDTVSVLAIGSGTLLNELTVVANILARGKNLKIYLSDWAYVFYGDKEYKEKALKYGKTPDILPTGWQQFYFWPWPMDKDEKVKAKYLPLFENHHQAIEEFKTIVTHLDRIYGTHSEIEVIKPAMEKPLDLPPLDLIISIDAFLDLPNMMWNLFYQFKLHHGPVRFITLVKTKPLGGFWESSDLSKREAISLKPVSIDLYDIEGTQSSGSYKLVERTIFEANAEQKKRAPEFILDPNRDSTQSPLE